MGAIPKTARHLCTSRTIALPTLDRRRYCGGSQGELVLSLVSSRGAVRAAGAERRRTMASSANVNEQSTGEAQEASTAVPWVPGTSGVAELEEHPDRLQRLARRNLWMHFTRMGSYDDHHAVPVIARGEGCYVFDEHGK